MFTRKGLFIVLVVSAIMLAAGVGSQMVSTAHAVPQAGAGIAIPYSGRLNDEAGQPVPDGAYDFTFALYDAQANGMPLWSETQKSVPVKGGAFAASLGAVTPIAANVLGGDERWLAVSVRGPGETNFTALTPRQSLNAVSPAAPAAPSALSCAHTHVGETWIVTGAIGLAADAPNGIFGAAFYGRTGGLGFGVRGEQNTAFSSAGAGVLGESNSPTGSGGRFVNSGSGIALYVEGNGSGADRAAIWASNTLSTTGMAAKLTNNSGYATVHIENTGPGEVLFLKNNGGSFLRGVDHLGNAVFRLAADGVGHAAGGWVTGGADFAELLPAVEGLGPGDVLVIGPDGKLARSAEAYQSTVVGVYSTKPGFVGGSPVDGETAGTIPLAVVGIVPTKVSAENGAIQPGDLLVASATPGHAMKAGPNPPQGTIIGKALEKLDAGTGVIKILATLQ